MESEIIRDILKKKEIKIRVLRSGMFQQVNFRLKKVKEGNIEFLELFTNKQVDISELVKVANEVGLPIEAKNGRAFPSGKSATDFIESNLLS
ncbi:MAG: hypothetical protein QXL16_02735 [Candidatus Micrarchaeaceae archaeon]